MNKRLTVFVERNKFKQASPKREEFEKLIIDEYIRKYNKTAGVGEKALRSGVYSKSDQLSSAVCCECSLCTKNTVTPENHLQKVRTGITKEDEDERARILSTFMPNPADQDFCFIINRLRNYKQEKSLLVFPVSDVVVFYEGVPQFIVRSTKGPGKTPYIKYTTAIEKPISKTAIVKVFDSRTNHNLHNLESNSAHGNLSASKATLDLSESNEFKPWSSPKQEYERITVNDLEKGSISFGQMSKERSPVARQFTNPHKINVAKLGSTHGSNFSGWTFADEPA